MKERRKEEWTFEKKAIKRLKEIKEGKVKGLSEGEVLRFLKKSL